MAVHQLSNSYSSFNGNIAIINKYMINSIVCMIQGLKEPSIIYVIMQPFYWNIYRTHDLDQEVTLTIVILLYPANNKKK